MLTRERFALIYAHQEADRIPIIDSPWAGTLRRWRREGMPAGMDWEDFFGIDKIACIGADISPRFRQQVLEETDRYRIVTTEWGVTLKQFKEEDSTPQFLDYKVMDEESWEKAKARMLPTADRINWAYLKENYPKWISEGRWIQAGFWFGFDVTHSWMMGTENMLFAMMEQPELVQDMFETYLSTCTGLFQMIWDAGYRFDEIFWPDDMGYKGTTFFSPAMYRDLLKPYHKRAIDWAHEKGIYAHLHSCGNIMTLVPDLMELGLDCLNPLEIKAGMEPLLLKERWGDRLTLHGGINAVLWDDADAIIAEIDRLVPKLKEQGGYIFSSDHSIPNSVSLETMQKIVARVKETGRY